MRKFYLTCCLLLFGIIAMQAQKTVTGQVSDSDGFPLIGVNISEIGTNTGTITDLDGNYSLSVSDNATLEFSLIGYSTVQMVVGDMAELNLVMEAGVALDEIVVTALGIEKDKKALAYSITEIGGENIEVAREVNVVNSLAGKVAGLNISSTATGAGGSSRIVIRGNSSISGNNQPLIVVDGVPIDNGNLGSAGMWGGQDWGDGISSVNPSDIETMSVLKGNSAAALYGYRAANGAIIIKTKSGAKKKGLGIEFNSNYVGEQLLNLLDFQKDYGHGNRGAKPTTADEALAFGLYAWGDKLDGSQVVQFDGESRPYSDVGDNLNRFYRTGNTFTNTIAFSGGTEDISYRLSGTALNNSDIIPNSGLDRYTLSFNTSANLGEKVIASVSGSYVDENVQNRSRLSDSPGNVNYTVYSLPASVDVESLSGNPDKLGATDDGTEFLFNDNAFVTNPYWGAYQFEANSHKKRLFGNFRIAYEIIENLKIQGRIGLDQFTRRQRNLTPYGTAYSSLGQLSESILSIQEINKELSLTYNTDITDNIGVNFLLGGNQQSNFNENLGGSGNNFSIPFLHQITNVPTATDIYSISKYAVNSLFGQAEISFNRSIYLTGTLRNDWFSTLTKAPGLESNNSKLYGSVGMSWVFSDMFTMPSFVDFGKVRASWAQVGGATSPYQLALTYGVFGSDAGNPLGGISSGSIPNSDLVPSTSSEFEIGADFRFLKNRIGLDVAYYNRTTIDDILNAAASPTSGYGSISVNVGEINNQGFEMLLNLVPVRTQKLTWGISLNFARNNNTVVSLLTPESDEEEIRVAESRTRNAYVHHIEGLPYSQIMGFDYERDASGNIMYDDNQLPIRGELQAYGTGVAPTTFGISNTLDIGNVSIRLLIDAKVGGYIYSASNAFGYTRGLHMNTLEGREDGNVGPVTIPDVANVQDYYQRIASVSSEFITKADFGKLRELIVSYRVPKSALSGMPFSDINLSLAGRNLGILWSTVDNVDPESTYNNGNAQGLEMFGVPTTRSIGLNLGLKF